MKVLNFGSLNYDYVYKVDHIIHPKETLDTEGRDVFPGGKGLNQSVALAKAGVSVYQAGCVGEDGKYLLDVCKENGIDTTYIKTVPGASGHTIIQVDKNAQNSILLYGGANRSITKAYVEEVLGNFEAGDVLLLQNEINELAYIIEKAYEIGMTIILNPSPFNQLIEECDLKKVSVFLLNEVEGEQLTGDKEPDKILDAIETAYPDAQTVLTLGSDGARYRYHGKDYSQPIYKVKAVDTTAAGDTFTGFFVAGMMEDMPIEKTLDVCAKASSIAVSREGAATSIPTRDEVLR